MPAVLTHRLNPWGIVVIESCDNYEQILALDLSPGKPSGGILTWAGGVRLPRVFFATRQDARAAIRRTGHYAKAFGLTNLPDPKLCRIEVIAAVETKD